MATTSIDCMIASSIAGSLSTMIVHPIDSLKVRMQTSNLMKQTLFRQTCSMTKEGMMSFVRGVFAPTFMKSFTCMLVFTTNNKMKQYLLTKKRSRYIQNQHNPPSKLLLSLPETFIVAASCGLIVSPFKSCCEMIKIQMQNDRQTVSAYRNIFHCTNRVIKHNALSRGMMITSFGSVPLWGVYLLIYDAWNRLFDRTAALGSNDTLSSLSVSLRVIVGGVFSGWSAWFVGYPMDYIKTQIQSHPIYDAKVPTIREVIAQTRQKFGYLGFYRGLMPCLVRSVPLNICTMWIYETVLQMRKKY